MIEKNQGICFMTKSNIIQTWTSWCCLPRQTAKGAAEVIPVIWHYLLL